MHLEADAVAKGVVEALEERLARTLRELRRIAGLLEDAASDLVQLAAGDTRAHRRERTLERGKAEPVVLDELRRRLADAERARRVGIAAGFAVAREDVDDDRLAGPDLPVPGSCPSAVWAPCEMIVSSSPDASCSASTSSARRRSRSEVSGSRRARDRPCQRRLRAASPPPPRRQHRLRAGHGGFPRAVRRS